METNEALTYAASAPFIAIVIGLIRQWWSGPPKVWSPIAIGLALLWGAVLYLSDRWEGDVALWIVTGIIVGFAASGMHSATKTWNGGRPLIGGTGDGSK